jgi:catechol 2,3-dioxygenase-like lactoylglutathione lyase family enzyme
MLSVGRFGTRDLDRAKTFYDAIAELLGAQRVIDRPELAGYRGNGGATFVIGKPLAGEATAGNGTQLVLLASSPEVVNAVHAKALELGGACEGPPGTRGPEEMGYYAAYFRDLDGNKLACFHYGASA